MSRIFGMNNHNTNVHNTNCTHFQMENGQMVIRRAENRAVPRESLIAFKGSISLYGSFADKLFDQ